MQVASQRSDRQLCLRSKTCRLLNWGPFLSIPIPSVWSLTSGRASALALPQSESRPKAAVGPGGGRGLLVQTREKAKTEFSRAHFVIPLAGPPSNQPSFAPSPLAPSQWVVLARSRSLAQRRGIHSTSLRLRIPRARNSASATVC